MANRRGHQWALALAIFMIVGAPIRGFAAWQGDGPLVTVGGVRRLLRAAEDSSHSRQRRDPSGGSSPCAQAAKAFHTANGPLGADSEVCLQLYSLLGQSDANGTVARVSPSAFSARSFNASTLDAICRNECWVYAVGLISALATADVSCATDLVDSLRGHCMSSLECDTDELCWGAQCTLRCDEGDRSACVSAPESTCTQVGEGSVCLPRSSCQLEEPNVVEESYDTPPPWMQGNCALGEICVDGTCMPPDAMVYTPTAKLLLKEMAFQCAAYNKSDAGAGPIPSYCAVRLPPVDGTGTCDAYSAWNSSCCLPAWRDLYQQCVYEHQPQLAAVFGAKVSECTRNPPLERECQPHVYPYAEDAACYSSARADLVRRTVLLKVSGFEWTPVRLADAVASQAQIPRQQWVAHHTRIINTSFVTMSFVASTTVWMPETQGLRYHLPNQSGAMTVSEQVDTMLWPSSAPGGGSTADSTPASSPSEPSASAGTATTTSTGANRPHHASLAVVVASSVAAVALLASVVTAVLLLYRRRSGRSQSEYRMDHEQLLLSTSETSIHTDL